MLSNTECWRKPEGSIIRNLDGNNLIYVCKYYQQGEMSQRKDHQYIDFDF